MTIVEELAVALEGALHCMRAMGIRGGGMDEFYAVLAKARAPTHAQGTEAQRATTVKQGVVHDGPVAKPCAQASEPSEKMVKNNGVSPQPYWEWPHGDAGDAVDFACDHCAPDEAVAFLNDWRQGLAEEWPGYMHWLKVQQDGAKASAAQTGGSNG